MRPSPNRSAVSIPILRCDRALGWIAPCLVLNPPCQGGAASLAFHLRRSPLKRIALAVLVLLATAFLTGCGSRSSQPEAARTPVPGSSPGVGEQVDPGPETAAVAPDTVKPAGAALSPDQLKAALKEKNPDFKGELFVNMGPQGIAELGINDPALVDISPLAGLSLYTLDLRDSHVTDIRPLQGMKITRIDLSGTGVSDVSVLSGMPLQVALFNNSRVKAAPSLDGASLEVMDFSDTPLEDIRGLRGAAIGELYLVNTRVKDLEPLRGGRLQAIWLNNAPVEDCSPLGSNPLVSVTLAGTRVSDISCFKGHASLERLHIGGTEVTDLGPLQWMDGLTRLVFTPNRIKTGIQYARRMSSIREIGTAFGMPGDEGNMFSPDQFWQMYDEGKFN